MIRPLFEKSDAIRGLEGLWLILGLRGREGRIIVLGRIGSLSALIISIHAAGISLTQTHAGPNGSVRVTNRPPFGISRTSQLSDAICALEDLWIESEVARTGGENQTLGRIEYRQHSIF
jgi:hypothetical protein